MRIMDLMNQWFGFVEEVQVKCWILTPTFLGLLFYFSSTNLGNELLRGYQRTKTEQ